MKDLYIQGSIVECSVGLVLVRSGDRRNAATVSFFSEVAHHPASLWVSLATDSYTCSLVQECGRFSLAVLHYRQGSFARLCGSVSGRDQDKCARLPVYETREGFLFLRGAKTSVACVVRDKHAVGDHTLFIAGIRSGEFDTRKAIGRHLLVSDLR